MEKTTVLLVPKQIEHRFLNPCCVFEVANGKGRFVELKKAPDHKCIVICIPRIGRLALPIATEKPS